MRYLKDEVLRALAEDRKMVFISGPRQVGKTTFVKHLLSLSADEGNYFNWDVEGHRRAILKDPEGFWLARFAGTTGVARPRVGLDEIHKYPRWKRFLKGVFDASSERADILVTGSGRLDVYQRGGDSLAGRYNLYHLHPFTVGELMASGGQSMAAPSEFWAKMEDGAAGRGAESALATIERLTGFPDPLFSGSERRLLRWRRTCHQLVIREDLRDLTRIREIGLMDSLVNLLPERVGSPLSLNALSATVGVAFNTMKGWIEALSRLSFLFEIRPYAGRIARALRREAKIYLYDFSRIEDPGARFENVVALHLKKLCDAWSDGGMGDYELHYVRDKEKREADFLVTESRRPYMLVEAKLSETAMSKHLIYFRDRLKPGLAIQIVRHLAPSREGVHPSGVRLIGAARFLSHI